MGYCNFIAAAEGLLMAAKAGIDLNTLAKIIPVSAGASGPLLPFLVRCSTESLLRPVPWTSWPRI